MLLRNVPLARIVAVFLSLPAAAVSADTDGTAREFSSEELQRLDRGQLLSRPSSERGDAGPLIGGTSWQVIDRPIEDVWAVLLDTAQYPRFLPQVMHAELVRKAGDDRTVLITHGNALLQVSYYLDVHIDPSARRITFRVDESRPRDVRSGTGFYLLRSYPKQRTLLAYGVLADIGDRFVAELLRANIREWILKVPWLVKRAVEQGSRSATPGRAER